MSPAEIRICLHYYAAADDYPNINQMTSIVADLIRAGLIDKSTSGERYYCSTPKNDAYCKMLTEMPLPVQKWVMPENVEAQRDIEKFKSLCGDVRSELKKHDIE